MLNYLLYIFIFLITNQLPLSTVYTVRTMIYITMLAILKMYKQINITGTVLSKQKVYK